LISQRFVGRELERENFTPQQMRIVWRCLFGDLIGEELGIIPKRQGGDHGSRFRLVGGRKEW